MKKIEEAKIKKEIAIIIIVFSATISLVLGLFVGVIVNRPTQNRHKTEINKISDHGIAPASVPPGAVTATEVYLRVDDLDGAIRRLESAGARLLSARAPRDWGDEAAYYADPDGNVLAVARATQA